MHTKRKKKNEFRLIIESSEKGEILSKTHFRF